MPCGRSGAASMATSNRAGYRKVNWPGCWSRFTSGRKPSGQYPRPPVNRRQKDTTGPSLRRRGAHTAKTTSRRHNQIISGVCGACDASHSTFSKLKQVTFSGKTEVVMVTTAGAENGQPGLRGRFEEPSLRRVVQQL